MSAFVKVFPIESVQVSVQPPITGIAGCCARTASGQATAKPASVVQFERADQTVLRKKIVGGLTHTRTPRISNDNTLH
jgi:hypothetical protein